MNQRIDRLVKERMTALMHGSITRRLLFIAAPLAVCLVLLFPATASAHAILLCSDPAKDAILRVPPREVRMWFSEDLNPAFSTASVVNASNAKASNINAAGQRVDNRDAHVSSSDTKEYATRGKGAVCRPILRFRFRLEQGLKLCTAQVLTFHKRIGKGSKLSMVLAEQDTRFGSPFVKNALHFGID